MKIQLRHLCTVMLATIPFTATNAATKDNFYVHGWGGYNLVSASSNLGLLDTQRLSATASPNGVSGSAQKGGPAFGVDLMWGQSNKSAAFKYGFGAAYIGTYSGNMASADGLYKFNGTLGMIPVTGRFTFRMWGWFIWGAGLGLSMQNGSLEYKVAGQDRSSDIPKLGGSWLVIDIHLGINVFHSDSLAVNLEARSYTTVANTVFTIVPTLTLEYRF